MSISPSEIKYIRQACAANFRLDGRSNTHYRPYNLIVPSSCSPILSNGSSRLFLPASNTDILCSIRAELVRPPMIHTNEGVIDLNVDILPYASIFTEKKDRRREEQEVSSTLSQLLLPHLIHGNSDLVVQEGRFVWRLNIDLLVTHCDGSLVDCCSMAIYGAFQNLKLPHVVAVEKMDYTLDTAKSAGKRISDEIMLDSDIANSVQLGGVLDCPVVITVCLLPIHVDEDESDTRLRKRNECIMVLDADRQEETSASSKVSISIDKSGNICGIHKYGTSSVLGYSSCLGNIKFDMLPKIQSFAIAGSQTVFAILTKNAAKAGASSWVKVQDEYSTFFQSQFELQ